MAYKTFRKSLYYTVSDLVEEFGISDAMVYKLCEAGKLASRKEAGKLYISKASWSSYCKKKSATKPPATSPAPAQVSSNSLDDSIRKAEYEEAKRIYKAEQAYKLRMENMKAAGLLVHVDLVEWFFREVCSVLWDKQREFIDKCQLLFGLDNSQVSRMQEFFDRTLEEAFEETKKKLEGERFDRKYQEVYRSEVAESDAGSDEDSGVSQPS